MLLVVIMVLLGLSFNLVLSERYAEIFMDKII